MTLMPVEIKEMSSNVNLPPPCYENVRKLAKIALFPVSKKVFFFFFFRMEGRVSDTINYCARTVTENRNKTDGWSCDTVRVFVLLATWVRV